MKIHRVLPSCLRITVSEIPFSYEYIENDKVSEFNLNLLTIDSEQLGIPETEYSSIVTMNAGEFTRICREMSQISETGNF